MRPRQLGEADPPRGPHRDLWTSCGPKVSGQKNLLPRFLLAHHAARCGGGRPQVRRMSVLRSTNPFTGAGAPNHPNHLAIRSLGPRHGRAPQKRPRRLHSPTHSSRQVYKWIEAKPITNLRSEEAVKFFLDITYRFGVPNCIIIDHRTNFTEKKFLDFCDGYNIRIGWASIEHLRTNGQVERANGMVLQGLKPRIFDRLNKYARRWVAEVPAILWNLRMTPN